MKNKLARTLKKSKKRFARRGKFLLRHPLLLPVSLFIALFFVGLVTIVLLGASTQGAADARIVNLFVEGEKRTVTTRAKTVGELLGRISDVEILEQDIVEPSREALILEDDTHVNVYRARSVELVDGERTITVFTAQRAPRLVAADAGIDLLPEDSAEFVFTDSTTLESKATERLNIKRSVEIKLNTYGALRVMRTTASTVRELFEQENIDPKENETVQPGLDVSITPNLLVSVNLPGVKTEIITEAIAFGLETKNDPGIQAGTSKVERAGVLGEKAIIYTIREDEAGNEVGREVLQEVVLKEPVSEIVVKGTKIVAPTLNPGTTVAGDKVALMSAAGIAESDYGYVDFIVSYESGWKPFVANSSSGAYGLCQALPASKMSSAGADYLTNPVTQLRWCSGYASGRYGGWAGAYNAWLAQRWW